MLLTSNDMIVSLMFIMEFDESQYDRISQETRLLEFSHPNVRLEGAIIKPDGSFFIEHLGTAKLHSVRHDPTIILHTAS